jgi:hypothetical protein
MKSRSRSLLSVLIQVAALAVVVVLYALVVTRGQPTDWLP